jgi:hypothetical protein
MQRRSSLFGSRFGHLIASAGCRPVFVDQTANSGDGYLGCGPQKFRLMNRSHWKIEMLSASVRKENHHRFDAVAVWFSVVNPALYACTIRVAMQRHRSSAFIGLAAIVSELSVDILRFLKGAVRSKSSLVAENLFLRKQLAFYQEHEAKPRRLTDVARVALVFWSRWLDWRQALTIVQPETLIP